MPLHSRRANTQLQAREAQAGCCSAAELILASCCLGVSPVPAGGISEASKEHPRGLAGPGGAS